MDAQRSLALMMVSLMALAGCLGATEPEPIEPTEEPTAYTATITWVNAPASAVVGEEVVVSYAVQQDGAGEWVISPRLVLPSFEDGNMLWDPDTDTLRFTPATVGDHIVSLRLTNNGETSLEGGEVDLVHVINVQEPQETAPVLTMPNRLMLDGPNIVWFEGGVDHANPSTCVVEFTVTNGNSGNIALNAEHAWRILMDFTESSEVETISVTATCGEYTPLSDLATTTVIIEGASDDADGDSIMDAADRCPEGIGANEGWASNDATDGDRDGCRDVDEDDDDDNDGVYDVHDGCPDSFGWQSTPSADYDVDGCRDADIDTDDDGDGVSDTEDMCPLGRKGWSSNLYSDWDSDGCSDLDEDDNDDNDDVDDDSDACPKGEVGWSSANATDFDGDGCLDATEDEDDDNDTVPDVNGTGAPLDACPMTPANATDVDERGCAAVERDTDGDGVNDLEDLCEGTPSGLAVNAAGCADLDNDGVFANVDACADSPARWSVNATGCAVVQQPVDWTETSTLTGPMQAVPTFNVPTLDGTYNFKSRWTGEDVYFFMFKYTDSNGNSNTATWGQNAGRFIRNLPLNTQLFYGSFDSTYHTDVTQRQSAVLAGLTAQEEAHWNDRIHFIDTDANNIGGGLGAMIGSFNNPFFMGIDRFQLARETGSLYAWTSQSNDPFHLSHEPNQWVAEHPTKVRALDPQVHAVDIMTFQRHAGGWGGGYNSQSNATFDLPNDLSSYDTLEVYHEHACFERTNRYQNNDGTYGGCHEWDYLAHLYICDATNASSCGTEIMRWITTYGREGMWLTDISPYMFMLNNDEQRFFKYSGANKGDLTVTFLFSNWGSGEQAQDATYAFSGGQFDGTYNNESRYDRQLNFTVPSWATTVEIVATITGHGFNQDTANCAEFCDHQHYYTMGANQAYEWHPIVYNSEGCEEEVDNGVVANQFGSWPFGRAGWCAGQDVKQWTYNITDWVDHGANNTNHLVYRGYYDGQEYVPSDGIGNGGRNIRAAIWIVFYGPTTA